MTSSTADGTETQHVHYTYDVFNRMIGEQVDSNGDGTYDTTQRYVYDGNNAVLTLDGSGNVISRTLYGPQANQVLATENASGALSWALTDQVGSVRDVINSSGTVMDHLVYNSFGSIVSQTNSTNQPRQTYAGMVADTATRLLYDHARFYDPATGTFISQDPTSFAGGDDNLYRYTGNNPVSSIDPSGLRTSRLLAGSIRTFGGVLEGFAGLSLGISTWYTGVDAIGGGIVFLHGIDEAQAGIREGISGKDVDSFTSDGLQKLGLSENTANLVDSGISIAGSLGAGVVNAATKVFAIAQTEEAAGLSLWQILVKQNPAGKALPDSVFEALNLGGLSDLEKLSVIEANKAITSGFYFLKSLKLALTGLTAAGDLFAGTTGALMAGLNLLANGRDSNSTSGLK